jgi:hypothetical protein
MSQKITLLLTFAEVSALTQVSPKFLETEITSGFLRPYEPLPGFRRFWATAVTEWIKSRQDAIRENPRTTPCGTATLRKLVRDIMDTGGRARAYATALMAHAIRIGRLKRRPCAICADPRSEAHHPDYSKPLSVIFLCQLHHKRMHVLLGRWGFHSSELMSAEGVARTIHLKERGAR